MRFGISANPTLRGTKDTTKKVLKLLKNQGEEVWLEKEIASRLGEKGMPLEDMEGEISILITVGGDGTVLRALQKCSAPVFAIHTGSLGFLNEIEAEEVDEECIRRLIEGDYSFEKHNRIRAIVDGEATPPVLNEIVVHTSRIVKMREFQLFVDGEEIDRIRADAMIIATPTGSTGYAYSAGGPLIDPRVDAMAVLPLAPFQSRGVPRSSPPHVSSK